MATENKPSILILFGASGRRFPQAGPIQSLHALIDGCKTEFNLALVTGVELRPANWPDAGTDTWSSHDGVRYYWLEKDTPRVATLRDVLRDTRWDLVILNSFFDREFTLPMLVLRRLGLTRRMPVILSPRGEFAPGALSLKRGRKKLFILLARAARLLDGVWLHATASHEHNDSLALRLGERGVLDAPDTSMLAPRPNSLAAARRDTGEAPLRLVFLGRITSVKNIMFALEVLSEVKAPVIFDLYGPLEDPDYWDLCMAQIQKLPAHIKVRLQQPLDHAAVVPTLADYDIFFMPSLGENFGHAIQEALSAGLPALVSTCTPWRGLEKSGAGWDLPLSDRAGFVDVIEAFSRLDQAKRHEHRLAARDFAEHRHAMNNAIEATRAMLRQAIEDGAENP